ncbi:hypothetical protein BKA62DRAFT_832980 [Auriculariales sp. MPI-PUGE-AT-0066]|nr:hypothetical protein BKA62DRAFT_832980 [Auriculariales sp. MPI-PUGE-AT-0066]
MALEKRLRVLTRVTSVTGDSMRLASIGRCLRAWVFMQLPVDAEMADRLETMLSATTHDIRALALGLISVNRLGLNPSHMAITWKAIPSTKLGRPRHRILQDITRRLLQAYAVAVVQDEFRFLRLLPDPRLPLLVSAPLLFTWDDVTTVFCGSELSDDYEQVLEHLRERSIVPELRPYRMFAALLNYSWMLANCNRLAIPTEAVPEVQQAYCAALHEVYWVPGVTTLEHLEAGFLPFADNSDFVEMCTATDIDTACDIVHEALRTANQLPSWSARLGDILFHLLDRRTVLHGTITMRRWRLSHDDDCVQHHRHISSRFRNLHTVHSYLQETPLNMLKPRSQTGGETTSSWRLYLATREGAWDWDTDAGQMFAIELALLSRLGLPESEAKLLVHELVGDERGVQLLLAHEYFFVELAVHAKMVDSAWWRSMRRRIFDLPFARWDNRVGVRWHLTRRELIAEVERRSSCDLCNQVEDELRAMIADQDAPASSSSSPASTDSFTVVGSDSCV